MAFLYLFCTSLKETILGHKSTVSRYEEEKKELISLIETLRDTSSKCSKLNNKLEEELAVKVTRYYGILILVAIIVS